METSNLTSKGQLLIPKRLRNKYGIQPGKKIALIESKEGLMLKAMDSNFFDRYVGLLKGNAPSHTEYKAWKKEEKVREEKQTGKK